MENNKNKKNIPLLFAMILSLVLILVLALASIVAAATISEAFVFFAAILTVTFFTLLATYIGYYNKFIKYKNKVAESLSLIDVYLKKRFDLIPNLMESVKGYMKYEKELLTQITELRKSYNSTEDENEKINLSNSLAKNMKKVFITAEEYPKLKASTLFKSFMLELSEIEDEIAASRRFYNSNINAFNSGLESFPGNIFAKAFGFQKQVMFKIDANQKVLSKIKFD